ncbi:hypothetical protein JCM19538_2948 [Jejuia pallidilutea]|uniref:Uncharacterized protein n=2 Tax=Jejuia pallidilutea TaxID=504487 RepID=A0A098LN90_9FLAO|nr:hypothetical protein JCM19538_2948 [Jejuia pallidilutea]
MFFKVISLHDFAMLSALPKSICLKSDFCADSAMQKKKIKMVKRRIIEIDKTGYFAFCLEL